MSEIKLTIKQEKFVNKYLECGNASEAYRFAYSAEKMKENTVNRKAYDLMKNGKIRAMLSQEQSKLQSESKITKERVLKKLEEFGFSDSKDVVVRDKLTALQTINKMLGYDAPQVIQDGRSNQFTQMTDEELDEYISSRKGI